MIHITFQYILNDSVNQQMPNTVITLSKNNTVILFTSTILHKGSKGKIELIVFGKQGKCCHNTRLIYVNN